MKRRSFWRAAGLTAVLLAVSGNTVSAQDPQPAVVETAINGNATVPISLPFSTNGLGVDHYQFSVVGNGYTWTLRKV